MRIAQLAPLAESVPPKLYGGTERVIAWLVDELVELGHDVTLFASGDSRTKGKLQAVWPRALRLGRKGVDPNAACALLIEAAPFPMWYRGPDLKLGLVNRAFVDAVEARDAAEVIARSSELEKQPRRYPLPDSRPTLPTSGPWNAAVLN